MISPRSRSVVFKLLLAGLLVVLVASYSADAAPTGKLLASSKVPVPAKAGTLAKPKVPAKPKASTKAGKPTSSTKAGKPTASTKAGKPTVSTKPTKPTASTKAGKPTVSSKAAKPTISTKPSTPPKPKVSSKAVPRPSQAKPKPSTKAGSPAKATPAPSGGKGSSKSPATGKQCLLKPKPSKNTLEKREPVVHPDAKSPVVLFHGTNDKSRSETLGEPKLSKTNIEGDLHKYSHKERMKGPCGGFYLTDSIIAAAQYACYRVGGPDNVPTAYVQSYKWNPPAGFGDGPSDIFSYPDNTPHKELKADTCKNYQMATAPMRDPRWDVELTDDFRQYAIFKQELLAEPILKAEKIYTFPCVNVPKGKNLPEVNGC
ncbi:hypothetical protein MD484_g5793, partial [Candolleomyces efflorescens]